MVITILFPEFLFSKAVCELQMAVDDLHAMNDKKEVLESQGAWPHGWRVSYGRRIRFLHSFFHLLSSPMDSGRSKTEVADEHVEESADEKQNGDRNVPVVRPHKKSWTLTHSYFANMGGLQRSHIHILGASIQSAWAFEDAPNPITAYAIVNCCVGSLHDPLPALELERDDIEDKSKADWLLKSIAVAQIAWLLVSVIDRAAMRLPITQLEICTSAFSLLAIATYLANWSKPKDVGKPYRLAPIPDVSPCIAWKYYGEPFVRRLYRPSESRKADDEEDSNNAGKLRQTLRIENDFVRLDGFLPPMTITMAISTVVFGGLHCLAWDFAFPTRTEMMIWMVASVLSATIPLATLLINLLVISKIRLALSNFAEEMEGDIKSPLNGNLSAIRTDIPGARPVLSLSKAADCQVWIIMHFGFQQTVVLGLIFIGSCKRHIHFLLQSNQLHPLENPTSLGV